MLQECKPETQLSRLPSKEEGDIQASNFLKEDSSFQQGFSLPHISLAPPGMLGTLIPASGALLHSQAKRWKSRHHFKNLNIIFNIILNMKYEVVEK